MNRSFKSFLLEKQQIECFCFFVGIAVVIAVLMRIFYPFPFTYPDTATYVFSAATGEFDVYRPMGYSEYLKFLHWFSQSVVFVFYVTYILLFFSSSVFIFSAKFLFDIKNNPLFVLSGLLLFTNSKLIIASNYLMSDGIFTVFALLFFTVQIWLVKKPSFVLVIANVILLYLMCKIRYSGLFCIPLSILVFFVSFRDRRMGVRLMVSCVPLLFGVFFYLSTKSEYKKQTSVDVFSGFGGWQSINNASVLFPEAKSIPISEFKTDELKSLHRFMNTCPDDIFKDEYAFGTGYIWNKNLPYKVYNLYLLNAFQRSPGTQWAASGKLFGEYSKVLIRHYPVKYLTEFVIPSFLGYFKFKPIVENDIVFVNEPMYQQYYGINVGQYEHKCKFFKEIDPLRRVLQVVLWCLFGMAAAIMCVLWLKSKKKDLLFVQSFVLFLSVLIILCGQSVSSPNTTWRYTLPLFGPMVVFMMSVAQQLLNIKNNPAQARKNVD